jgi:hypothetical protein
VVLTIDVEVQSLQAHVVQKLHLVVVRESTTLSSEARNASIQNVRRHICHFADTAHRHFIYKQLQYRFADFRLAKPMTARTRKGKCCTASSATPAWRVRAGQSKAVVFVWMIADVVTRIGAAHVAAGKRFIRRAKTKRKSLYFFEYTRIAHHRERFAAKLALETNIRSWSGSHAHAYVSVIQTFRPKGVSGLR